MYLRGEFLALRWDRALRKAGHPGLDSVMRDLLLPARVASAPVTPGEPAGALATDRLLMALRPWLGNTPAQEVERHIVKGEAMDFEQDLAGPCLSFRTEMRPAWELGFDRASFDRRLASGVDPGGPAYRAGLREGMKLEGWSVWGGDIDRQVELNVVGLAEPLRYLPHSAQARSFPVWEPRPGAQTDSACRAWIR